MPKVTSEVITQRQFTRNLSSKDSSWNSAWVRAIPKAAPQKRPMIIIKIVGNSIWSIVYSRMILETLTATRMVACDCVNRQRLIIIQQACPGNNLNWKEQLLIKTKTPLLIKALQISSPTRDFNIIFQDLKTS